MTRFIIILFALMSILGLTACATDAEIKQDISEAPVATVAPVATPVRMVTAVPVPTAAPVLTETPVVLVPKSTPYVTPVPVVTAVAVPESTLIEYVDPSGRFSVSYPSEMELQPLPEGDGAEVEFFAQSVSGPFMFIGTEKVGLFQTVNIEQAVEATIGVTREDFPSYELDGDPLFVTNEYGYEIAAFWGSASSADIGLDPNIRVGFAYLIVADGQIGWSVMCSGPLDDPVFALCKSALGTFGLSDVDISEATATVAPVVTAIAVSATDLYTAYDENRLKADTLYTGNRVSVTGVVVSVDRDWEGNAYVQLGYDEAYSDGSTFLAEYGINCYVVDSHLTAAADLRSGNVVTLEGVVEGLDFGEVLVRGCTIKSVSR
jgi:hypothetical protein